MARRLSETFLYWLHEAVGEKILTIISQYQCLSLAMNGNSLKTYFQGCKILTIHFKNEKCNFEPLSKSYIKTEEPQLLSIIKVGISVSNLQQYLDCVIGLISRYENKRQEERIRQEIAAVNNRSREASNTDFFIIDQEYGVTTNKTSKFDLVTIKWPSTSNSRKRFSPSNIEIVVFELKLGFNAVGGTSHSSNSKADLKSHIEDFNGLQSNKDLLSNFKEDIVKMFIQQVSLKGFFNPSIKAFKCLTKYTDPKNEKELRCLIEKIPVKFGFILSDYKSDSKCLREQINQMSPNNDFLFATSSYMGYGLFEHFIKNKHQLFKMLS